MAEEGEEEWICRPRIGELHLHQNDYSSNTSKYRHKPNVRVESIRGGSIASSYANQSMHSSLLATFAHSRIYHRPMGIGWEMIVHHKSSSQCNR
ncbi:hypothetical protein BLOT_003875 [Blomia tropicalis]|nr:hypothetical protein BLOT_003875 [Blomia tropicalis]